MKKIYFCGILFALLISCNYVEILEEPVLKTKAGGVESLNFRYDGTEYYSEYYFLEDSTVVYMDENVERLLFKLKNNQQLAMYVYPDNTIKYFDSYEIMSAHLDKMAQSPLSRVISAIGYKMMTSASLTIYHKDNGGGDQASFTLNSTKTSVERSTFIGKDEKGIYWNDRMSSLSMACEYTLIDMPDYPVHVSGNIATYTLFEHTEYGGRSISFSISPTIPPFFANLKNYKMPPIVGSTNDNWNDKGSSSKFIYYPLKVGQ